MPSRSATACLAALLALAGCAVPPPLTGAASSHAILTPVAFSALPGWQADHLSQAMPAFKLGCTRLAMSPPDQSLGGDGTAATLGGQAADWGGVCAAARALPPGDDNAARAFVEQNLQAYAVAADTGATSGMITGYYEPEARGARTRGGEYQTPLLSRPTDLVQVDLGDFGEDLKGRSIGGRVQDGKLVPYFDRAQIVGGALAGRRLDLLYLADPIDAFVMQIQGSGRVKLPNGRVVRMVYAAQNGRPYVPIGRLLAERGEIPVAQVTMQSIRAWLNAHPGEGAALMDENPSYVFFKEAANISPDEGPPGTLGVALTPGRSIAIDRKFIPLGAPVWIATTDPLDGSAWQRLMVAQDLGGAIRGPVRADIFFGWDADAENRAGRMRQQGSLYVLLPKPS